MKKGLKLLASILGLMVLLLVIAAILLMTFVSPNRFKPIISEQVMKATGRTLSIDGDLSWTFFPVLGVKVGHLSLSNPTEFNQKTFAEIDEATVSVKLLPLLHAQIESNGVVLNGMKLYLIKNAAGQTNWQNQQQQQRVRLTQQPAIENNQDEAVSSAAMVLVVSALDVSHADIVWIDEQAKKEFVFKDVELHAKNISLDKPFHFTTAFSFSSVNPKVNGKVNLSSNVLFNLDKQSCQLDDMELTAKINHIDLIIHSNLEVNLEKQTISLEDFIGQSANMSFSGKVNVTHFANEPQITGSVQINPTDMKAWLNAINQDTADLQVMKNVSGNIDFSVKSPAVLNAQGHLKIDTVETSQLKVTDVNVEMRYKDNVVHLAPLTAKLYQGDLYSQIKVNLNGTAPQFAVQANLSNIQVEPLLDKLGAADKKIKLSGLGNVDLQVTTAGSTSSVITRNLNGTGNLKFENGVLTGIDMGYLIENAYSLIKQHQPTSNQNTNKTTFGSMTATVAIHDGVVSNNDLHFQSPRFDTKGNGSIDLVNQSIDYSLLATVRKISDNRKDDVLDLYGLAIPIQINGNLNDPKIRLNTDALLKQVAKQQIDKVKDDVQKQIQDKATDMLNNLLGH